MRDKQIGIGAFESDHLECRIGLDLSHEIAKRNFVARVLSFDRQGLHTAKSIINHTGLPDPAALQSTQDIFFQSFTWEGAKERLSKLRERGIGQAGDFELGLGRHVGSL